jgi:hypothetical protein
MIDVNLDPALGPVADASLGPFEGIAEGTRRSADARGWEGAAQEARGCSGRRWGLRILVLATGVGHGVVWTTLQGRTEDHSAHLAELVRDSLIAADDAARMKGWAERLAELSPPLIALQNMVADRRQWGRFLDVVANAAPSEVRFNRILSVPAVSTLGAPVHPDVGGDPIGIEIHGVAIELGVILGFLETLALQEGVGPVELLRTEGGAPRVGFSIRVEAKRPPLAAGDAQ